MAVKFRTAVLSLSMVLVAGVAMSDVWTHTEYKAVCSGPYWTGPWLSYQWQAQDYADARRPYHRDCWVISRKYFD